MAHVLFGNSYTLRATTLNLSNVSINDARLLDTFLMNSGEILPELWPTTPLWTSINLRSRCFINKISSSLDYINNDRPQVNCYGCIESGLKIIKHFVCSTRTEHEIYPAHKC